MADSALRALTQSVAFGASRAAVNRNAVSRGRCTWLAASRFRLGRAISTAFSELQTPDIAPPVRECAQFFSAVSLVSCVKLVLASPGAVPVSSRPQPRGSSRARGS